MPVVELITVHPDSNSYIPTFIMAYRRIILSYFSRSFIRRPRSLAGELTLVSFSLWNFLVVREFVESLDGVFESIGGNYLQWNEVGSVKSLHARHTQPKIMKRSRLSSNIYL